MKKQLIHFVGIDVSKLIFDAAVIKNGDSSHIYSLQFDNSSIGFREFKNWLSKNKIDFAETVLCIEYTGYYSKPLANFITAQDGNLWMEMSLKLIRSLGVQRGKNDKLDAKRIAHFAQRNILDFVPYKPQRSIVERLKMLLMLREKLINSKTSIMVPIKELTSVDKASGKIALKAITKTIQTIESNIKAIDLQLDSLISADDALSNLFKLVTSVPGVGRITCYYLMYYTNEFKNYFEAKQLACYCGVVPFEYTSGSSVKGK